MYIIGLDLAVQAAHKAVVVDEQGRFLTPLLRVHTQPGELDRLLMRARNGQPERELCVVMEPTGMAWFPIAVYLVRHEVTVYLVNSQEVADLRRYYKRHAKSDRIDARVLARLPLANPEHLHCFHLPSAKALACQRSCKQLDRLSVSINAIQNRVQAIDRFAWPGLEERVFAEPFAPATRWMRTHWYDPGRVLEAGTATICEQWQASAFATDDTGAWCEALVDLAADVLALYGRENQYLDFTQLQAEVCREQEWLATRRAAVPNPPEADCPPTVSANSPESPSGNAQRCGAGQRCGLCQFYWGSRALQLHACVPWVERDGPCECAEC